MGSFFQKALKVLKAAALINGILLFVLAGAVALASLQESIRNKRANTPGALAAQADKSRFAKTTPEQRYKLLERITAIAMQDGRYWEKAQTADEAFPGVYSAKHVPPYWTRVEEDYAVAKRLGKATIPSLPPYESLTRNERLTLCYTLDGGVDMWELRHLLDKRFENLLSYHDELLGGEYSAHNLEWRLDELPQHVTADLGGLTQKEALAWLDDMYPRAMLSPLTKGLIRTDSKQFTPGQAYVEYHYKDDEWKKLWPKYVLQPGQYSPDDLLDTGFYYYRIYGEHGVIAEGVRPYLDAGFHFRWYLMCQETEKVRRQ